MMMITSKVNVIVRIGFELAYYDVAVHQDNNHAITTHPEKKKRMVKHFADGASISIYFHLHPTGESLNIRKSFCSTSCPFL